MKNNKGIYTNLSSSSVFQHNLKQFRKYQYLTFQSKSLQKLDIEQVTKIYQSQIKFGQINTGYLHSLILTEYGNVFSFGQGKHGQLGLSNNYNINMPTLIQHDWNKGSPVQISAGYQHSLVLTDKGEIFSFGNGEQGQLGLGNNNSISTPTLIKHNWNKGTPVQISAGYQHSLVLTDKGEIFSFGNGEQGQLGLGNNINSNTPTLVQHDWNQGTPVQISAGYDHNLVLTDKSEVFSFGNGKHGQLGLGNNDNVNIPTLIRHNWNKDIPLQISAGAHFSLVLTNKHKVFSFGEGQQNQLGLGHNDNVHIPTLIPYNWNKSKPTQISAGYSHSLVLTNKGMIFGLGEETYNKVTLKKQQKLSTPTIISYNGNEAEPREISAGGFHNLILNEHGKIFSFGNGDLGQLGLRDPQKSSNPTQLEGVSSPWGRSIFISVTTGKLEFSVKSALKMLKEAITKSPVLSSFTILKSYTHQFENYYKGEYIILKNIYKKLIATLISIARDASKNRYKDYLHINKIVHKLSKNINNTLSIELLIRGNQHIQTEHNLSDIICRFTPYSITPAYLKPLSLKKISTLSIHPDSKWLYILKSSQDIQHQITIAIQLLRDKQNRGELKEKIRNAFINSDEYRLLKNARKILTNVKLGQINVGNAHSIILTEDGYIFSFGLGEHGQLGLGHNKNMNTPTLIKHNWHKGTPVQVAAGENFNLILTNLSEVYSFGEGKYGQLGLKQKKHVQRPTLINHNWNNSKPLQVAAGKRHSLVLTYKKEIFGFGFQEYNQLGLKDAMLITTPTKIKWNSSKPAQITAGGYHNLVITETHNVFSFGNNEAGQLGLGHYKAVNTPVLINFNWNNGIPEQISAGSYHSLILTSKHEIFSFGFGEFGQLGLGHSNNVNTPTLIKHNWNKETPIQIAAGYNHSLVLTNKGKIFSFGHGEYGQLGLGHNESINTPTLITHNWNKGIPIQIAAGENFSLVLTDKGEVFSFGNGEKGQLGIEHQNTTNLPVQLSPLDKSIFISTAVNKTEELIVGVKPVLEKAKDKLNSKLKTMKNDIPEYKQIKNIRDIISFNLDIGSYIKLRETYITLREKIKKLT